uniref:Uncharacterized protein n=1 Tax=Arion vulgaris TaxID=1028688 RepID=A0A0B6ZWR7_9EUPU
MLLSLFLSFEQLYNMSHARFIITHVSFQSCPLYANLHSHVPHTAMSSHSHVPTQPCPYTVMFPHSHVPT